MKIYLADYNYGHGNITEFEVEEKEKTYKIISSKDIIGWCLAHRIIKKEDIRICKSLYDAFMKVEADAKETLDQREREYKSTLESHNAIREVSDAIRSDPAKLDRALKELQE